MLELLIFYLLGCAVALVIILGEEYYARKTIKGWEFDIGFDSLFVIFSWASVVEYIYYRVSKKMNEDDE